MLCTDKSSVRLLSETPNSSYVLAMLLQNETDPIIDESIQTSQISSNERPLLSSVAVAARPHSNILVLMPYLVPLLGCLAPSASPVRRSPLRPVAQRTKGKRRRRPAPTATQSLRAASPARGGRQIFEHHAHPPFEIRITRKSNEESTRALCMSRAQNTCGTAHVVQLLIITISNCM